MTVHGKPTRACLCFSKNFPDLVMSHGSKPYAIAPIELKEADDGFTHKALMFGRTRHGQVPMQPSLPFQGSLTLHCGRPLSLHRHAVSYLL